MTDRLFFLVVRVPAYRSGGPGFDSRLYKIFREIVGLERGPLNLLSAIEVLLGRNNSDYCPGSHEDGRGDPLCWPRNTLYAQKLAPITDKLFRSVGVVHSRTQVTEF
jgi:hypothetical protein